MKKQKVDIKKIIKKKIELRHQKLTFIEKRSNINRSQPIVMNKPKVMKERDKIRIFGNQKPDNKFNTFNGKYQKDVFIDYDAIICISSYDRYFKVKRILNQIHSQSTHYTYKIILLNDGSTDKNYEKIRKKYPNIDYIKNDENNGKNKYYLNITTLFKKASEYKSYVIIEIDDDFILSKNFLNTIIDIYFKEKEKNNKCVAIYYHLPEGATETWERWKRIDGGVLFDSKFLALIDNTVRGRVSESGSGVWRELSKVINNNNLLISKPEFSLAFHDGNDDSKMNTNHRINHPIRTENFKIE